MDIVLWIVLGALAGWIASAITGVREGWLGNIVVGILGAVILLALTKGFRRSRV
jgi:uncharacterized membrane protein YeaQ/YmgE (transglycosylase-associated protein family)